MAKGSMSDYERKLLFNGRQRDEYRLSVSSTRWEDVSAGLTIRTIEETLEEVPRKQAPEDSAEAGSPRRRKG